LSAPTKNTDPPSSGTWRAEALVASVSACTSR